MTKRTTTRAADTDAAAELDKKLLQLALAGKLDTPEAQALIEQREKLSVSSEGLREMLDKLRERNSERPPPRVCLSILGS